MLEARRRIERGQQVGARIHSSGPYFGTARPGWRNAEWTPERIRDEVDVWAAHGVRGFKAKGINRDHLPVLIERAHQYGLPVTAHLDSGAGTSVNPRDAIYMGIDRIEHFLGGDAIVSTRGAYASLEQLDVNRPEVDAVIALYLKRNVFYDATVSAYGYWYDPKDARVFTTWMDEMSFLTPHARAIAKSRLPRKPVEQFRRIYEVKFKELKRFYDAGGERLITLGTDHPSWGEFLSGFSAHREVQALRPRRHSAGRGAEDGDDQRRARAAPRRRPWHDRTQQARRSLRRRRQPAAGHHHDAASAARDGAREAVRRRRPAREREGQDGTGRARR